MFLARLLKYFPEATFWIVPSELKIHFSSFVPLKCIINLLDQNNLGQLYIVQRLINDKVGKER